MKDLEEIRYDILVNRNGLIVGYEQKGFAAQIPLKLKSRFLLTIIASNGMGWDHVSVSLKTRAPTWEEMCFIKDLCFHDHECVMQLHLPKADYINIHDYVLHMWRPQGEGIPMPLKEMV